MASAAFIGPRFGVQTPCLAATAFGADEALGPAGLRQIGGTGRVVGKLALELEQGAGKIDHGERCHCRLNFPQK